MRLCKFRELKNLGFACHKILTTKIIHNVTKVHFIGNKNSSAVLQQAKFHSMTEVGNHQAESPVNLI